LTGAAPVPQVAGTLLRKVVFSAILLAVILGWR